MKKEPIHRRFKYCCINISHFLITAVDDGQGYLLLTSGSRILKLGLDITDAPQHLYNVSEHLNITG